MVRRFCLPGVEWAEAKMAIPLAADRPIRRLRQPQQRTSPAAQGSTGACVLHGAGSSYSVKRSPGLVPSGWIVEDAVAERSKATQSQVEKVLEEWSGAEVRVRWVAWSPWVSQTAAAAQELARGDQPGPNSALLNAIVTKICLSAPEDWMPVF